jgi:hypothetical protein
MADVSSRLPKKLSSDISRSLGAAVRLTGSMDNASLRRLKSATDDLERTLKNYDRVAEGLISSTPAGDQLEKLIQDRVPSDYRNKAYKRLFWRTVYKVVPFMQQKRKTEDEINALSRVALASFSVIFRAIIAYSNALIRQSTPDDVDPEDLEEKDPEEFDPELEEAISGIEKEVKPSQGKDQVQRKTDQNVKNQQRRSTQTPGVSTPEEYRSFVGLHEGKVDAARVSVTRYKGELTNCLKFATDRTFSLIQGSAIKAVALGQVLNTIASASREAMQPGTFIACKALLASIMAANTIVIQSVALNRSQRSEINKHLRKLQKQTQPLTEETEPGQELPEE